MAERSPARGRRSALVALFSLFIMLAAPTVALAQGGQIKLALRPVGQAGTYFDLTMGPGESRTLEVDIADTGTVALAARTYAADVYTIINGGFGGRLRDEPRTGTTRWLDYPTAVLQLTAGQRVRRSFTITVPADAGPGEYITSLVLENDQPIQGDGVVDVSQIIRQAVAVVVTLPGPRSPALAIGEASQAVVAGTSVVSVAVANTGNVRLKPVVELQLFDAVGTRVSQTTARMDTFYAHTDTFVEVPLAALLVPGSYTVQLTLTDTAQGVRVDKGAMAVVVAAPAESPAGPLVTPLVTGIVQVVGEGQISLPVWSVLLAAGLLLGGAIVGALIVARRRRRPGIGER